MKSCQNYIAPREPTGRIWDNLSIKKNNDCNWMKHMKIFKIINTDIQKRKSQKKKKLTTNNSNNSFITANP